MLKKEFKRKDVQRARNLIMGNSGAQLVYKQVTIKKQKTIKRETFGQKVKKHGQ